MVDAILLLGDVTPEKHLSDYHLYVGFSSDYTQNTDCDPDGEAFAIYDEDLFNTYSEGPLDDDYGQYA